MPNCEKCAMEVEDLEAHNREVHSGDMPEDEEGNEEESV